MNARIDAVAVGKVSCRVGEIVGHVHQPWSIVMTPVLFSSIHLYSPASSAMVVALDAMN
jgi:hypothetical protein